MRQCRRVVRVTVTELRVGGQSRDDAAYLDQHRFAVNLVEGVFEVHGEERIVGALFA